jgi:hypothetical protein
MVHLQEKPQPVAKARALLEQEKRLDWVRQHWRSQQQQQQQQQH